MSFCLIVAPETDDLSPASSIEPVESASSSVFISSSLILPIILSSPLYYKETYKSYHIYKFSTSRPKENLLRIIIIISRILIPK